MTEPSEEARDALHQAEETRARIERRMPFWRRTAADVANAVADNHFGDLLRTIMTPRRGDRGEPL
jgi:hypothetical protein